MTSGRVGGEGGYKSVRLFYFLAVTELPGPAAGFNGAGPGGEAASEEQGWGNGGGGSSRQGRGLWGAPLALPGSGGSALTAPPCYFMFLLAMIRERHLHDLELCKGAC